MMTLYERAAAQLEEPFSVCKGDFIALMQTPVLDSIYETVEDGIFVSGWRERDAQTFTHVSDWRVLLKQLKKTRSKTYQLEIQL